MTNRIDNPAPPAIPFAPEGYQRPYIDQTHNVLRLFFNRLTSTLGKLLSVDNGGKFLYSPYGSFYDTAAQTAAAINTAYAVVYGETWLSNGVSVVDGSKLTVGESGIYSFDFNVQLDRGSSSDETLWLWIRKNGVDIDPSAKEYHITGPTPAGWTFSVDMGAGDYIQMMWAVTDTDVFIHGEGAAAPRPGIPSAVMAVSFVSNL